MHYIIKNRYGELKILKYFLNFFPVLLDLSEANGRVNKFSRQNPLKKSGIIKVIIKYAVEKESWDILQLYSKVYSEKMLNRQANEANARIR